MPNSLMKKYSGYGRFNSGNGRVVLALIMVIMAAIASITLSSGCGSETATISSKDPVAPPSPELTQEYIENVAGNEHANTMEVREAAIHGDDGEKTIIIGVERPASLQDGSITGVMGAYGQHVFNSLFEIEDVEEVTITMYGIQQGVKDDEVAMRIVMDRAMYEEADWSMFGPMMMSDMLNEYYVAPEIEKNMFS